MPLAAIAAIASLAAAGTSIGQTIYNDVNQPSGPKAPTPTEMTNSAIATETANRATATKEAGQVLPDLQFQTGGGLSPDAYSQLSSQFSGNAQLGDSPQMQQLVAKFLGLDTGASFGGNNPFGSSTPGSPLQTGLAA